MCIVAIIRSVLPCSRVSYAVNVVEGEMSSQDRRIVVFVRWYRAKLDQILHLLLVDILKRLEEFF